MFTRQALCQLSHLPSPRFTSSGMLRCSWRLSLSFRLYTPGLKGLEWYKDSTILRPIYLVCACWIHLWALKLYFFSWDEMNLGKWWKLPEPPYCHARHGENRTSLTSHFCEDQMGYNSWDWAHSKCLVNICWFWAVLKKPLKYSSVVGHPYFVSLLFSPL